MEKAQPIWQELPTHYKADIVSYLDFKSRCLLRSCSKSDYELVTSCPVHLGKVELFPPTRFALSDQSYQIDKFKQVMIFLQVFQHPKSYAREVSINFDRFYESEDIQQFFILLLDSMKTKKDFKIISGSLYINDHAKATNGREFLELLQFFDSSKLKKISLSSQIAPEYFERVSKSEQWKNAVELKAFGYYNYNIPIESLSHFDRLNIQLIDRLSTEKAWKFIENFLKRNPALGSCFQVHTMFALEIDEILENFLVPPNNEPTEHEYSTYYKHTQLFELPNPNHICVVKISERGICAAVSRITHIEPDFRWHLFGVRIDK